MNFSYKNLVVLKHILYVFSSKYSNAFILKFFLISFRLKTFKYHSKIFFLSNRYNKILKNIFFI